MHAKQLRQAVVVGALVVAAFWLISLIWGLAGKAQVAVGQEAEAKRQFDALEIRKETLQANLAELDTPRGRDGAIRTAFGVAKVGEEVIVVVPRASTTATTTKGFWARWFGWL